MCNIFVLWTQKRLLTGYLGKLLNVMMQHWNHTLILSKLSSEKTECMNAGRQMQEGKLRIKRHRMKRMNVFSLSWKLKNDARI